MIRDRDLDVDPIFVHAYLHPTFRSKFKSLCWIDILVASVDLESNINLKLKFEGPLHTLSGLKILYSTLKC